MIVRLTFACVGLVCIGAVACAQPALAAGRPSASDLPSTGSSDHFVVHYGAATTSAQADLALANAEQAYAKIVGEWAFPAPADDGDGKTDIYVAEPAIAGASGEANPTAATVAGRYTGYILLGPQSGLGLGLVSHEFFHVVQYGLNLYASSLVKEATADWVQTRMSGSANLAYLLAPGTSLDCFELGTIVVKSACDRGYSRSILFSYLDARFGPPAIRDLFGNAGTPKVMDLVAMLQAALTPRGIRVEDFFADFAVANASPDYLGKARRGQSAGVEKTVETGTVVHELPPLVVSVDHLAAKYVRLVVGTGAGLLCAPAGLKVTVSMPGGVAARPYLVVDGAEPRALTIDGATATTEVPWSTCAKAPGATLVLPNASRTVDAASFTVTPALLGSATVTQPPTTTPKQEPASPTTAPQTQAPAQQPRQQAPVKEEPRTATPRQEQQQPASSTAPILDLTAASVQTRSGRALRLALSASGNGIVQVTCNSLDYSSENLVRRGANVLSIAVPRHARAGTHSCTLRALSVEGFAGRELTLRVLVRR